MGPIRTAVAAALIATLIRLALDPLWGAKLPLILFYPAIMVSGWAGGFGQGLLTTLLSAAAAEFFWTAPTYSLAIEHAGDIIGLVIFVAVGGVISGLNEAARRAAAGQARAARERAVLLENEHAARVAAERAEERLRVALDAGRMGAWEWEIATGRVTWSPGLEAIHGLAPGTFAGTFDAVRDEIHADDRARVERAIGEALDQRRDHQVEYQIVRRDGAVRWVEGRGRLTFNAEGRPDRMVGVCADITDRRRAEALLAAEVRARDDFVSIASHELRNPVNALQLQIVSVLRAMDRADGTASLIWLRDRIRQAGAQVGRLTRLTNNLLEMSSITAGSMVLERQQVDLREVVDDMVAQAGDDLKGSSVTIHAPQPVVGWWDRLRLEQVVLNLLSNAIKYGNGQPVELSLEADGASARLSVTDRGIGMSPEQQKRLFERFERAVSGSQYGGFGLGLWITRQFVEAMQGRIDVRSAPREGSTFTVVLPLAASHDAAGAGRPIERSLEESV